MCSIDKSVPLPKARRERAMFPFLKMNIGDSFLFNMGDYGAVTQQANYYKNRSLSLKFTVRKIDSHSARCWRVR